MSSVAALSSQSGMLTSFTANPAPILHQPFLIGPGFSPIPAKIVTEIVSGKFVELDKFLSSNIVLTEPEPQLFFDGCLVWTLGPKKVKVGVGLLDLHVGAHVVLSSSLEGPLPIPTADSPNSLSVCGSHLAFPQ